MWLGLLVAAVVGVWWWRRRRRAAQTSRRAVDRQRQGASAARPQGTVTRSARVAGPAPEPDDASRYRIEYADANGEISEREIRVLGVTGNRMAIYIDAFCLLRNARRTFRAERILKAFHHGGAVWVNDPELHFLGLVPSAERPDPEHAAVMARVRGGLLALVWIARADREISIEEKAILLDFVEARNALAGQKFANTPWNRAKAAAFIDQARPTFATSVGYLAGLSRSGREYAMARTYADAVAAAGGDGSAARLARLFA